MHTISSEDVLTASQLTEGSSTPPLFCPSIFGTRPNDLLQLDYIELEPRRIGAKCGITTWTVRLVVQ